MSKKHFCSTSPLGVNLTPSGDYLEKTYKPDMHETKTLKFLSRVALLSISSSVSRIDQCQWVKFEKFKKSLAGDLI